MRNLQRLFIAPLACALACLFPFPMASASNTSSPPVFTAQQQTTIALERGYRTGYSDGYPSGFSDTSRQAARDYTNKEDYRRADRAYNASYGALEDYKDGYRQGFEAGYDAGFERRNFDSSVPAGINRRTTTASVNTTTTTNSSDNNNSTVTTESAGVTINSSDSRDVTITSGNTVVIPANTLMTVELLTNLSTESSQRGDHFQVRVVEPREYEGATIDGEVVRVKRPGRIKGTGELQLAFRQISLTNNRSATVDAQLVEVVDARDNGVGDVDTEGGVQGKSSTKDDTARIGAASGIGAAIGAIFGGGRGAAVGAVIGGATSTGGVLASRGKEIRLPRGQQMKIRTSGATRIP